MLVTVHSIQAYDAGRKKVVFWTVKCDIRALYLYIKAVVVSAGTSTSP